MSTYSSLGIELIGTGELDGTWGTSTNTNLGTIIEQAISGYATQAITNGADTVITIPNGASGVARNMFIECTGTLTANRNLIVPASKPKLYFIFNNTSGGFAVTVKVAGQTGVSVPNGKKMLLHSNGTDVFVATNYMVGDVSGNSGTVTNGVYTAGAQGISGMKTFYDPVVAYQTGSIYGQYNAISGSGSAWYKGVFLQGGSSMYLLGSAVQTTEAAAATAAWSAFRPFTWNLTTGAVSLVADGSALSISGPTTISAPVTATGLASGGQFNAVAGAATTWYNTMLRNDGTNVYLLQTAAQTTQANAIASGYNSFRPFSWNLATGEVTISGNGQLTSFGGGVLVASGTNPNCMSLDSSAVNGANLRLTGTTGSPAAPNKYIRSLAGNLEVLNSAYGATIMTVTDAGNLTMAGNVTAYSDERLKKDWESLPDTFIYNLAKVKYGTYTRTDIDERQAGASAQDMQKLLPETVHANADGMMSLAYGNAALVAAIKLAEKVVELEARLAKLEA